jgi:hypothetical protein
MIGNTQIHPSRVEHPYDSLNEDEQQLAQENHALRAIVAELLIKNQNLRWALLGEGSPLLSHEPRVLMTSGGTPLRRNARTAGIP